MMLRQKHGGPGVNETQKDRGRIRGDLQCARIRGSLPKINL